MGCGGGGGSGSVAAANAGVAISGVVVDRAGFAAPNVGVALVGHPLQPTPEHAPFSFTGVEPPYTALVIESGSGSPRVTVYEGLTRPDPTLVASAGGGLVYGALIEGSVSGGGAGIPAPPNHAVDIFMELLAPVRPGNSSQGSASPVSGAFAGFQLAWAGSPTTNARVHALQYEFEPVGGLPLAFTGYGAQATPLAHGDALINLSLSLVPVGTSFLTGVIEVEPGYDLLSTSVSLELLSGMELRHTSEDDPPVGFSYFVPTITGTTHAVGVLCRSADQTRLSSAMVRGLPSGASGIVLDVPAEPEPLFPPNNALGIDLLTAFQSEATGNGVYRFEIFSNDSPSYVIYAAEPVAFMPDLSPYGLASLGSDAAYTWWPIVEGPSLTVDELAGPGGLAPTDYTFHARGPGRSFRTRP